MDVGRTAEVGQPVLSSSLPAHHSCRRDKDPQPRRQRARLHNLPRLNRIRYFEDEFAAAAGDGVGDRLRADGHRLDEAGFALRRPSGDHNRRWRDFGFVGIWERVLWTAQAGGSNRRNEGFCGRLGCQRVDDHFSVTIWHWSSSFRSLRLLCFLFLQPRVRLALDSQLLFWLDLLMPLVRVDGPHWNLEFTASVALRCLNV